MSVAPVLAFAFASFVVAFAFGFVVSSFPPNVVNVHWCRSSVVVGARRADGRGVLRFPVFLHCFVFWPALLFVLVWNEHFAYGVGWGGGRGLLSGFFSGASFGTPWLVLRWLPGRVDSCFFACKCQMSCWVCVWEGVG